jgi:hypothetical protein
VSAGSLLLVALTIAAPPGGPALDPAALVTEAERSGWVRTGALDEVERLVEAFPRVYPGVVTSTTIGRSAAGRPIHALVATAGDVGIARRAGRPTVIVQAGLHAGEIDGKDAGFDVLRAIAERRAAPGLLERVIWVFVPVVNVDGFARFGPDQRPNQAGPEATGWRTTARNLNLNRDFVKLDAPETRALVAAYQAWDAALVIDLHTTDGSRHRHEVSVQVEPAEAGPAPLRAVGRGLRDAVVSALVRRGFAPLWFYPSLLVADHPERGFAVSVDPPRYGLGYRAATGRLGALVETHAWRSYRERVRTQAAVLEVFAEQARARADAWVAAAREAARTPLAGAEVDVAWGAEDAGRRFPVLGYAYTHEPSPVSGAVRVVYHVDRPQRWRVPVHDRVVVEQTVRLPAGGYVVPPEQAEVLERLRLHGLVVEPIGAADAPLDAEVFRASAWSFGAEPYEGRQVVWVEGAWAPERVRLPADGWWVPADQPGARLLAHLLEPTAPDALVGWGFMSSIFERKEHVEDYVLEPWAEALLARDPREAARFAARLAADPAFAADPRARLEHFARLHPSWDRAIGRYPIVRLAARPGVTSRAEGVRSRP